MSFALIFQSVNADRLDHDYSNRQRLIVTRHPLFTTQDGKSHRIGAGVRVTEPDIVAMRQMLDMNQPLHGGWLSDNLLFLNESLMLWYVPGRQRPMHFLPAGQKVSRQYLVHWPTLLMQYHIQHGFRIAACASRSRPTQDTRLYHAPLMNVYGDTSVCFGSATGGKGLTEAARNQWESAIFDSNFSHKNHDRLIRIPRKAANEDVNRVYMRLIREKANTGKPFYAREMTPLNLTLNEWLLK